MKNIFKNIGLKLVLIVGVVSIFTIGLFSYILIQSQKEILLTEVERHASQLSETIRNSTRYDMLLNLRAHLHQIISDIAREPSIMVIRVMNKEGKIIYSSSEKEIGTILEKEAESCYACHTTIDPLQDISMPERTRIFHSTDNSIRALGVITPIYNEPSCWQSECHAHNSSQTILGVLDISTSLEKVDEQLSESQLKLIIAGIITILAISFIIGLFVHLWVNKPVRAIVEATKNVASGNLNYVIPNISQDELGILANSFNIMTQKLLEMRQQLFQSDKMASLGRLAAGRRA